MIECGFEQGIKLELSGGRSPSVVGFVVAVRRLMYSRDSSKNDPKILGDGECWLSRDACRLVTVSKSGLP